MDSFPTRVGLAIAIVMAAGWQTSAAAITRNLTITFTTASTGSSVECTATMAGSHKKAKRIKHKHQIVWKLDGTLCAGFDAKKVALVFDDKVMKNGMTFYGVPNSSNSSLGSITQDVTDVVSDAPKNSRHFYTVTYKMKNAGDPEIDIDSNPTPGPGTPPPPTGPTR